MSKSVGLSRSSSVPDCSASCPHVRRVRGGESDGGEEWRRWLIEGGDGIGIGRDGTATATVDPVAR